MVTVADLTSRVDLLLWFIHGVVGGGGRPLGVTGAFEYWGGGASRLESSSGFFSATWIRAPVCATTKRCGLAGLPQPCGDLSTGGLL